MSSRRLTAALLLLAIFAMQKAVLFGLPNLQCSTAAHWFCMHLGTDAEHEDECAGAAETEHASCGHDHGHPAAENCCPDHAPEAPVPQPCHPCPDESCTLTVGSMEMSAFAVPVWVFDPPWVHFAVPAFEPAVVQYDAPAELPHIRSHGPPGVHAGAQLSAAWTVLLI